jgi:hypothetical protein
LEVLTARPSQKGIYQDRVNTCLWESKLAHSVQGLHFCIHGLLQDMARSLWSLSHGGTHRHQRCRRLEALIRCKMLELRNRSLSFQ